MKDDRLSVWAACRSTFATCGSWSSSSASRARSASVSAGTRFDRRKFSKNNVMSWSWATCWAPPAESPAAWGSVVVIGGKCRAKVNRVWYSSSDTAPGNAQGAELRAAVTVAASAAAVAAAAREPRPAPALTPAPDPDRDPDRDPVVGAGEGPAAVVPLAAPPWPECGGVPLATATAARGRAGVEAQARRAGTAGGRRLAAQGARWRAGHPPGRLVHGVLQHMGVLDGAVEHEQRACCGERRPCCRAREHQLLDPRQGPAGLRRQRTRKHQHRPHRPHGFKGRLLPPKHAEPEHGRAQQQLRLQRAVHGAVRADLVRVACSDAS